MEGHVRQKVKGGSWYYSFEIPTTNGKRKRIERVGGRTKKEALNALTMALAEYKGTGKLIIGSKDTFSMIFDAFIDYEANATRKPTTIKRYQSLYKNHMIDTIGNIAISAFTPDMIQEYLAGKLKTHSTEYVRSINNLLYVIFGYAVRMDKIKTNPMLAVKPPKQQSEMEVSIYTDDELKKLNERLKTTNLHMAYQIGINLGLRAGECYALRWSDIDLENKTVKVYHQLQNYNKRWCFTSLKTQNSYRTIMFSDKFKEYLLAALELRQANVDFYGDSYKANKVYDAINDKMVIIEDFVNVKPNGEMLNTNSHKVISRIAKSEFNIDFKFHNLRHTHATILLEGGVNPRFIQERLGHSKLEFTLRMYTHITRAMNDQASSLLNSRLDM